MDSSISREKCVQCAWFLYTFLPVLFYFSIPLLPFPRCNFPLSVSKNPLRKKKGKKKKKDSFSFEKFWSFFFSPPPLWQLWHRGKFSSIPFFNSFYHSTRENWLRLILEPNPLSRRGIWFVLLIGGGGRKMGAQSLTEMPVLFVQPTLNEICTVYSLSRGKWR